jgi:hypothetical protein
LRRHLGRTSRRPTQGDSASRSPALPFPLSLLRGRRAWPLSRLWAVKCLILTCSGWSHMRLGARARACVHALRACCVGSAPRWLGMWRVRVCGPAQANGIRPRAHPGRTKSPLSTPAADPQQGGTTMCPLLVWREGNPTHCAADRPRRGVAMQ